MVGLGIENLRSNEREFATLTTRLCTSTYIVEQFILNLFLLAIKCIVHDTVIKTHNFHLSRSFVLDKDHVNPKPLIKSIAFREKPFECQKLSLPEIFVFGCVRNIVLICVPQRKCDSDLKKCHIPG